MTTVRRSKHRRGIWTKIFGWGLLLWALSAVVTYATANVLLVPTLVLLGSFLVPVTFAAWAFERGRSGEITTQLLFQTFVVGRIVHEPLIPMPTTIGPRAATAPTEPATSTTATASKAIARRAERGRLGMPR